MLRPVVLATLAPILLSGCAYFGFSNPWRAAPADPTVVHYQAAMADFSTCATATDPAIRAEVAQKLATYAARLQADSRPQNPDHFFMTDRVVAAAGYCAESLR